MHVIQKVSLYYLFICIFRYQIIPKYVLISFFPFDDLHDDDDDDDDEDEDPDEEEGYRFRYELKEVTCSLHSSRFT